MEEVFRFYQLIMTAMRESGLRFAGGNLCDLASQAPLRQQQRWQAQTRFVDSNLDAAAASILRSYIGCGVDERYEKWLARTQLFIEH